MSKEKYAVDSVSDSHPGVETSSDSHRGVANDAANDAAYDEGRVGEPIERTRSFIRSTTRSYGIRKSEILVDQYLSPVLKVVLLVSVFFVAYAYGLDGMIRYQLQAYATNSYAQHSLLSTVNVIKAVVAAAAQPTYARLSDRFGRLELIVVSIIFYSVGTVIASQSYDIQRYAGGQVLYQIGYTGIIIMLQILLADLSTLNWRLVCSFVPALPFIINTWISGDVLSSLYPSRSWSYGIGIWAFIFPLACIPLLVCLIHMEFKARRTNEWKILQEERTRFSLWTSWKNNIFVQLVVELDLIGILLMIIVFGLILVPLTLGGGVSANWKTAKVLAPLIIGVFFAPVFIFWERNFASYPIAPFKLLKDRGVWSAILIGMSVNWIWYMPNSFMYTVLIVGMRASIKAASRIVSLYSFVSVITGPLLGLVVVRFRRLKPFIMFGTVMWIVSLAILYVFRGSNDGMDSEKYLSGVIGALCLMGFGAGFFTYSTQVSISTCTNHEYMSVLLSLYLSSYNIGSGIGSAVSGCIWTNRMYGEIVKEMEKLGVDTSLAVDAYGAPLTFIVTYVWGTPERRAVVLAYANVQRMLCLIGLILCFPLFIYTLFLRDHRLDSVQSLGLAPETEKGEIDDKHPEVVLNNYDDDWVYNKMKSLFGRSNK